MLRKINDKLVIVWDPELLTEQIESLEYNEEEGGEPIKDFKRSFITPKEEYRQRKNNAIDFINSFEHESEYSIKLGLHLTKTGAPHKGRNQIIYRTGIIQQYDDYYGSHNYEEWCFYLKAESDGNQGLQYRIVLGEINTIKSF